MEEHTKKKFDAALEKYKTALQGWGDLATFYKPFLEDSDYDEEACRIAVQAALSTITSCTEKDEPLQYIPEELKQKIKDTGTHKTRVILVQESGWMRRLAEIYCKKQFKTELGTKEHANCLERIATSFAEKIVTDYELKEVVGYPASWWEERWEIRERGLSNKLPDNKLIKYAIDYIIERSETSYAGYLIPRMSATQKVKNLFLSQLQTYLIQSDLPEKVNKICSDMRQADKEGKNQYTMMAINDKTVTFNLKQIFRPQPHQNDLGIMQTYKIDDYTLQTYICRLFVLPGGS